MNTFWKMHGAGNDFVVIDGRFDGIDANGYSEFAEKICHRKFGVGADGILVVKNSDVADIEMVYYNADGTRGEMCGNGIRCFSKFVYENEIVEKTKFAVNTLDGIKNIELIINEEQNIEYIKVDMGKPSFNSQLVPVKTDKDIFVEEKVMVSDREFTISSILMGVPHTVIFVDKLDKELVMKYGWQLEKHDIFPKRCNINFVEVVDRNTMRVQTWERGCGYTLACGTGITASVIIANYLNKTDEDVKVYSEGGELSISLCNENAYMIGGAVKVFEGVVEHI